MPGSTPVYGLRYLELGDAPDIAKVGKDLSEDVESELARIDAAAITSVVTQVFTGGGSWNKPAGARYVHVRAVGGGAAGGGAGATGTGCSLGSGGQGGAYAESVLDADTLAGSVAVGVGAGGAGVSGGTGGTGGDSSFGTHVIAPGGGGGGVTISSSGAVGTAVGASVTPTITGQIGSPGTGGHAGIRLSSSQFASGHGGDSRLGQGGRGTGGSSGGVGGGAYGGGGSGAANGGSQSARPGASGASGVVIVTSYIAEGA